MHNKTGKTGGVVPEICCEQTKKQIHRQTDIFVEILRYWWRSRNETMNSVLRLDCSCRQKTDVCNVVDTPAASVCELDPTSTRK